MTIATPKEALEAVRRHADEIKGLHEKVDSGSRTLAEFKETADKWREDFDKAMREIKGSPIHGDGGEPSMAIPKAARANRKALHNWLMDQRGADGTDIEQYQTASAGLKILLDAAFRADAMSAGSTSNVDKLKKSPLWQQWESMNKDYARKAAMDTTEDSSVVPSEILGSSLIDRVRDAARVAPIFMRVPMPGPTFKLPLLTADASGYLIAEETVAQEDTGWGRATASKPTFTQVTLGAVKLMVRVVGSIEMIEDATIDTARWLTSQVATVTADVIDDAIINGDTAATHQDSNVTASDDRRKAWLGLRAHALDNSHTTTVTGLLTSDVVLDARKAMGKYGQAADCALICSYNAYHALLKDDDLKTVDKYGAGATVLTGEVARVSGVPVIVTEWLAANLNAAGAYDGSTTNNTGALVVNKRGFLLGERRNITVKSAMDHLIESDQFVTVASWRGDFEETYPLSTNETVHYLVDITA